MKKSMILLGILAMGYANAQTDPEYNGRIGVNIDLPKSSLHIGRHTGIPANSPQGLILPHLSTEQRDEFERTKLTNGLMIFNTTKNCIDWWNGTKWTCTDGTQADIPLPPTTPISLPNIEIGNSMYWFSSIYDDDYLSNATSTPTLAIPTAPASLAVQAADGVASGGTHEPILNVQGKIPAKENALEVVLPINVITAGTLPAFTTSIKIPAQYTKNNQGGIATLSWEQGAKQTRSYTQYIIAKIYAENEEIELKQLDLVAGLGNDHLGIFMGSFKYPRTKAESEGAKANWTGHYDLRLISGIPDKHFNKLTNISPEGEQYRHRFIYAPTYIPNMDVNFTGQTYLNNNLGANYANIHHEQFNSGQQAKTPTDHHAYGSLGQWGRVFDGHELMTWVNGTSNGLPNKTTYNVGWHTLAELTQFYDNCPAGWKTPTQTELLSLRDIASSSSLNASDKGYFAGGLRIPMSGLGNSGSLNSVGSYYNLWSSTPNTSSTAYSLNGNTSSNSFSGGYNRFVASTYRCLKE